MCVLSFGARMTCPHLEYRAEANGQQFDEPRAYCTVAETFVQPMRADVCNDRFELRHDEHCEIYLEYASEPDDEEADDDV